MSINKCTKLTCVTSKWNNQPAHNNIKTNYKLVNLFLIYWIGMEVHVVSQVHSTSINFILRLNAFSCYFKSKPIYVHSIEKHPELLITSHNT